MRVLFQMSPTDSGHMLDAPHASKLGPHRAFFASEDQNRLEKFRPYGLPTPRLATLRRRATGKTSLPKQLMQTRSTGFPPLAETVQLSGRGGEHGEKKWPPGVLANRT